MVAMDKIMILDQNIVIFKIPHYYVSKKQLLILVLKKPAY